MTRCRRAGLGIGAALWLASSAQAQLYGDFKLDPRTYASPSGEVTLFVDPSQPSGGGAARYRCLRAGKELWSGERPYTLWEAEVADDGLVAGYAYAAGYEGGRDDALTIVLLAPDGMARLEERSKREGFLSDMGSPEPMVAGLFLDPENDRLVVRERTGSWASVESWRTYSLSEGTPGPRLDPCAGRGSDTPAGWIQEARPVPATGLVLVRQDWRDFDADRFGAVFTLLEREGTTAWRLDWPEDHTVRGDSEATERLLDEVRDQDAVLGVEPGRFTLRQVATNERITFAIERVRGAREGWEVREVARAPFAPAEKAPASGAGAAAAEPQPLALEHLGTIQLGSAPPSPVIRDVMTFALDGQGRPGFLRRSGERIDFVRVDGDGANALEIPLPAPPDGQWLSYELAWTRGERWVLTGSTSEEAPNHAWWLDAANRTATPIEGYAGPSVESVAGTPEGGFVVLGTTWYDSGYFTSDLVAFGSDGARAFALGGDQGDPKDPASLFSPEALTVLASGELVVLSNVRNTLQFFSPTGAFLRLLELEQVWGREPNYPTGVRPDRDGGLLVHDFEGEPPIVCMDAGGKVVGGFAPHFADGRPVPPRGDVLAARDGSLWTSDGDALLVLDRQGLVQRVLGAAPEAAVLGKIGALALGPDDRIHAADERTGAVHVFQASGALQHVCVAAPDDFVGGLSLTPLTVTDAGHVFLGDVHFAADGARLARGELRVDSVAQECYAQRGSERLWLVGYEALYLIGPAGEVVRKLERAPDGKWLRSLDRAAVAPDGSIALATGGGFGGGTPGIHLYSAGGDPLRSLAQPEGMPGWATFAFDGERLAIGIRRKDAPGAVVLLDAHGRTLGRFEPEREAPFWLPFFAARGKELWLFDGERSLERYALP